MPRTAVIPAPASRARAARPVGSDPEPPPTIHLLPAVTPPPVVGSLFRSSISRAADPAARPGTMPEVGETFLGFRLVGELGRGSFARVFLAEQEVLAGRQVALKVTLRPTREAERLARLQHANVVPVYSVHTAGSVQVICMPYLGRQTIADQLRIHRSTNAAPHTGRRKPSATRRGPSTMLAGASRSRHDGRLSGG